MSIITEALEKAQKTSSRSNTGVRNRQRNRLAPLKFLLLTLSGALIIVGFFLTRDGDRIPVMPLKYENAPIVKREIQEKTSSPRPMFPGEVEELIQFTGIMYTQEEPLAVVNGEILSKGENIGEFKILEIGKNFLKIGSNEEEFILKLQR